MSTLEQPSAIDRIDPPVIEPDNVQPQPPGGRGESPVLTSDTARQGPEGSRILYIVAIGTVGAIIAMGIAYIFFAVPHS